MIRVVPYFKVVILFNVECVSGHVDMMSYPELELGIPS